MHPHAAKSPSDVDGLETGDAGLGVSLARIGKIMARPELKRWRLVMVAALVLTLASKVFAVYAPVFFGDAINKMTGPEATMAAVLLLIGWWTGARILSSNLPYLRDALFAPVSQDAQRLIAVEAYGHAQGLSLAFHQTRRTGALNRIIDRGVAALDYLIRFLAFNIRPPRLPAQPRPHPHARATAGSTDRHRAPHDPAARDACRAPRSCPRPTR